MTRRFPVPAVLALLGAILTTSRIGAQPPSASAMSADSARRQWLVRRCERAVSIVRSGESEPDIVWALAHVHPCDGAEDAMAAYLPSLAAVSDTVVLRRRFWPVFGWRDPGMYAAAMRLAVDSGATSQSRIMAMSYLLTIAVPNSRFDYRTLVTRGRGWCRQLMITDSYGGTKPMPGEYVSEIRRMAEERLRGQLSAAERNAASCVATTLVGRFTPNDP